MFITFEGIDLSGKSTQIILLKEYLNSKRKKVITVREPGGTQISEKIRDILLDKKNLNMEYLTEFLLFSSSRHQLTREVIIPKLKQKYFVISDRYYDSSTAYQGYGGMIELKTIRNVNNIASGSLTPDLTFLINISIEECIKRKKLMNKTEDRIEQKKVSYFNKVIKGYLQIAKNNKNRFVVIDGTKPIQEIHSEIISVIKSKVKI
ncbi:MAG TPA: dTMP kinase [Ignavibacteria bacterium]|nr:dTMP kinase [Ignavibacteria bacterium]HMR39580.1 dTMP kinase [Ignavibacteria bacterium]